MTTVAKPGQVITPQEEQRIIQNYGTMAQINAAKQRGQQLMQRSMQVTPGLIGTGSQLGGALAQLINAYTGSKMTKKANEQENALMNAIAQAQSQGMQQEQGQSYSQAQPAQENGQVMQGTAQIPSVFDQQIKPQGT